MNTEPANGPYPCPQCGDAGRILEPGVAVCTNYRGCLIVYFDPRRPDGVTLNSVEVMGILALAGDQSTATSNEPDAQTSDGAE